MNAAAVLEPAAKIDIKGERRRAKSALLYVPDDKIREVRIYLSQMAEEAMRGDEYRGHGSIDELPAEIQQEIADYEAGTAKTYGPFDTWAECVAAMEADKNDARQ